MTNLTIAEYKIFELLVSLKQDTLKEFMGTFLKSYYKKVEINKDYILAEGDIPIGLVAHMDTVFSDPPKEVFYDKQKNVIWSPEGLGADDRAGVFTILQIVKSGLRPHIILTTDEELGGLGAEVLVKIHTKSPFKKLKYLIQLDRRGLNDCVFYDCITTDFQKYIANFGFIEAYGSFSDISTICPAWDVCGVNLSVGYVDEHRHIERLYVSGMLSTIQKVKTMLQQEKIPDFVYSSSYDYGYYHPGDYGYGYMDSVLNKYVYCVECHKPILKNETIGVQCASGSNVYYCYDCFQKSGMINWCENCGEAFEVHKGNETQKNCYICNAKLKRKKNA
jgi:hypothetical protein